MSIDRELKILQWNCHSLRNKLSNFKLYLYTHKPHIACLSETWLSTGYEPKFINYTPIYEHRGDAQAGGGLAILVRSDVSFLNLDLVPYPLGNLEVCGVKLFLKNTNVPFSIMNVYNPCHNITVAELNHYSRQLGSSRLIVGDFNAHSPMWEPNKTSNITGKSIEDLLLHDPSICLLTPASLPTFYSIYHNSFSTLDLSLISSQLQPISTVFTGEDLGSDHCAIFTCVGVEPSTIQYKVRPSWKFQGGSWSLWSSLLIQKGTMPQPDLEASSTLFANNIRAASLQAFSQTKEVLTPKYSKPWWTPKCAEAVAAKRTAKKALLSCPSPSVLIAYKRAEARVKWEVKRAKQDSWRNFCNTVTSDTPLKLLWKRVKGLRTPYSRKSQPFIVNNTVLSDPLSKVEALATHYEEVSASPAPSPYPSHVILPLALALSDDGDSDLNQPITLYELNKGLEHLKKTSPGLDQVHNEHLSHLPTEYQAWLLADFNHCFLEATLPTAWKTSLIVPIPKPNKMLTSVSSFRPISLLSCVGKLLELILNKRLGFFLEQTNSFRASQGGFRCRIAAIDQVARLEAAIRAALKTKSILLVAFCDLTLAFDKVWHTGLLYKLSQCGVRGTMLRWLRAYLTDRYFQVQFEGETSSMKTIKSGVPQGAILSPLLFNVMMRDLPSLPGVSTADYADDVTFFTSSPDMNTATNRLELQLSQFFEWAQSWGLTLNLSKTKCMCFTNKKVNPPPLNVNGIVLEYVQNAKYLGVVLDAPRLRWEPQINSLNLACIPFINLLQSISSRHWGSDQALLLKLYKVLIRSRLDYAAALYASAAPTILTKLNVIQNNCLRIALGCRKTTPVSSMEVEANLPPLSIHRSEIVCKYYLRLIQLPLLPVVVELFHNNHPQAAECGTPYLTSFVPNAKSIFSSLQVTIPRLLTSPLISPMPPWFNTNKHLLTDFSLSSVSSTTSQAAQQIYQDLVHSKYSSHTAAFTDGSCTLQPIPSTSAAFHVPSRGILLDWKLRPEVAVIESELFAIHEALNWSLTNLSPAEKLVIFTDSQASISLIKNRRPKSYLHLIFKIQTKLMSLLSSHEVFLQYIPGHKGIGGNEVADQAAAEAHSLRYRTITAISKEELARQLNIKMMSMWNSCWLNNIRNSGKGLFISLIKGEVGNWPWALNKNRAVETALARLRTGHAGVKAHLARFNMVDSPLCSCGSSETIHHLLLTCPIHASARTNLTNALTALKVPVNLKNLLGGGPFSDVTQDAIVNAVASFLTSTNMLQVL